MKCCMKAIALVPWEKKVTYDVFDGFSSPQKCFNFNKLRILFSEINGRFR